MTRDELNARMRVVLNELRLCSHVPAASAGGGGQSASGKDASRGGRRPPGDLGATEYERAYGPPFALATHRSARTDRERAGVLQDAERERDHLRGHETRRRSEGESHEDTVRRMLKEAVDWSPDYIAASAFRISAPLVRRYRMKNGRDAETGRVVDATRVREERKERQPLSDDERAKVAELDDQGMSLRAITLATGIAKSTVSDYLATLKGKRAA